MGFCDVDLSKMSDVYQRVVYILQHIRRNIMWKNQLDILIDKKENMEKVLTRE